MKLEKGSSPELERDDIMEWILHINIQYKNLPRSIGGYSLTISCLIIHDSFGIIWMISELNAYEGIVSVLYVPWKRIKNELGYFGRTLVSEFKY